MDASVERRILGLIGLGLRARNAVVGIEQVCSAARRGRLALAIVAPDASANSRRKALRLLSARGVRVLQGPSAAALGEAAGRDAAAAIGILDRALAKGIGDVAAPGARRTEPSDQTSRPRTASRRRKAAGVFGGIG